MASCSSCGSWIPDDQWSPLCSMCYGDPAHGRYGYYRDHLNEWERQQHEQQHEQEQVPPVEGDDE